MPEASLTLIAGQIEKRLASGAGLNARVKFDFGADGLLLIDATQSPPVVTHEDGEADVTLLTSLDTFAAILSGSQDPNVAFLMGKLKIKGSMGLAMKLNALLED